MAIERKVLPVAPWKGLYVDGMTVPGGLSQAENIDILPNGWAKRRMPTRTLDDALTVKASQGLKELVEFRNAAGTRYLFADMNISTTMKVMGADVTGTTDYECGTWADVITGLTAGTAILPQYAVMQDRLFRVDGTNTQYVFTTNAAYTYNGVTAPAAAPTVASTTGGSMTAGEYNCYYTYVKKDGTYVVESDPCPVANITIAGSAINITIVSSSDDDVTHIRLYRTLYGLPSGYAYYDKEVAKATYVATPVQQFNVADASLTTTTLETDNDAPPTSIGLTVAGNRMFYLTKTAVYWSKIEEPEHVPPTWYSAIDPNDGDLGMAICAMQNYVLVFKRHKTFMYDANSAEVVDNTVGIARHIISTDIGCMAQNSVQSCGEQNCIMWLSHEGVMKWSGGEITNVSKDRVNTIIDDIMNTANSEYYVDSAYYGKKYHLLLVERNSGATLLTDERHLVYNFETDSWTEYKYYSYGPNTRYYETNLAVTTDSNKKDVFLAAIAQATNATSAYLGQMDYDPTATSLTDAEILDSAGDGVTALDAPRYSFTDALDNVYVLDGNGNVFKVTSAGVKSTIVTATQLVTALSLSYPTYSASALAPYHIDTTNSCFYASVTTSIGGVAAYDHIVKITFAGAITEISKTSLSTDVAYSLDYPDLYATTSLLFYLYRYGTAGYLLKKYASSTESTYYTITGNYGTTSNMGTFYGLQIYEDDLYLLWSETSTYTNYQLIKLTTITGTASASIIDTGISATTYTSCGSFLVVSDSEVIIEGIDSGKSTILKSTNSGGTWSATTVVAEYTQSNDSSSQNANIQKTTGGNFLICNYSEKLAVYDSNWEQLYTVSISAQDGVTGVSRFTSIPELENVFIICGYDFDNVYKIYPTTYWRDTEEDVLDKFWSESYDDTNMDIRGVFGKIVSNYEDLSIPNHKRITRAYLDTESEYATCGVFALEGDFTTNKAIHTTSESAEPSGAVSRAPFASAGQETWDSDSSFNSGTVENWETHRLDVGTQGRKFRYSIKFGDIYGANQGTMYLKPPMIETQVKGKY
jgi:hypothetical protein